MSLKAVPFWLSALYYNNIKIHISKWQTLYKIESYPPSTTYCVVIYVDISGVLWDVKI